MSALFDFKSLNGKTEEEARSLVHKTAPGVEIRVFNEEFTMGTMDHRTDRVNIKLEKLVVVDAWIG
jgi:hypothetical protein